MISEAKTVVTNCPKCGRQTFTVRMGANHSNASTYGSCSYCHHQATVIYQNDSFGTKIKRIG